jgi:hypothetical protein
VFAFQSTGLTRLGTTLEPLQTDSDPAERVDTVWGLDEGMILNLSDGGTIDAEPSSATHLGAIASENPLLWLAVMLQDIFQSAWTPKFRLVDYLAAQDVPIGPIVGQFGESLDRRARQGQSR